MRLQMPPPARCCGSSDVTDRLWLLRGDLDSIEHAVAWYIQTWGQHLPGVSPYHTAGVPTATANMAMTVIRKNVSPLPPTDDVTEAVLQMVASDRDEALQREWEHEHALDRLAKEAAGAADFLDSYSDESDLARAFPMVVSLMRTYAERMRAALSDDQPALADGDNGPDTDG